MEIQINGVYEHTVGKITYRIYTFRKNRGYFRSIVNEVGTSMMWFDSINKRFLEKECKYIGQSRATWEDLFQTYSEVR